MSLPRLYRNLLTAEELEINYYWRLKGQQICIASWQTVQMQRAVAPITCPPTRRYDTGATAPPQSLFPSPAPSQFHPNLLLPRFSRFSLFKPPNSLFWRGESQPKSRGKTSSLQNTPTFLGSRPNSSLLYFSPAFLLYRSPSTFLLHGPCWIPKFRLEGLVLEPNKRSTVPRIVGSFNGVLQQSYFAYGTPFQAAMHSSHHGPCLWL
jgi:hypothetical protein